MPVFQHHPDDFIYIRVKGKCYEATVADFEADCASVGLSYSGLPSGKIDRIYLQDNPEQHTCADSHGNQEHYPLPYDEAEGFIDAIDDLLAAQQARFDKAPKHEPTYAELRAAEYPPMADYLDGIVKGDQVQVDKYIADCLAVKAKHPKE